MNIDLPQTSLFDKDFQKEFIFVIPAIHFSSKVLKILFAFTAIQNLAL